MYSILQAIDVIFISIIPGAPVDPDTSSLLWRIIKEFGQEGDGQGEFKRARATAVYKKGTVVVDHIHHRVYVFSNNGVYQHTLMSPVDNPDGKFMYPAAVGITSNGQIAITEGATKQDRAKYVKLYNVNGTYHSRFCTLAPHEAPHTKVIPESITVSSSYGTICVGDAHRKVVTIHSGSDGSWKRKINLSIKPNYLAINSRHQIIVSDWQDRKVVCVDDIGDLVFALDSFCVDGKPGQPHGVTYDWHDGTLYVAVREFNEKTGTVRTNTGHVINNTGHIHQYSSTGKFMHCAMKGLYGPRGITWYNGSIYIANELSVVILGRA